MDQARCRKPPQHWASVRKTLRSRKQKFPMPLSLAPCGWTPWNWWARKATCMAPSPTAPPSSSAFWPFAAWHRREPADCRPDEGLPSVRCGGEADLGSYEGQGDTRLSAGARTTRPAQPVAYRWRFSPPCVRTYRYCSGYAAGKPRSFRRSPHPRDRRDAGSAGSVPGRRLAFARPERMLRRLA